MSEASIRAGKIASLGKVEGDNRQRCSSWILLLTDKRLSIWMYDTRDKSWTMHIFPCQAIIVGKKIVNQIIRQFGLAGCACPSHLAGCHQRKSGGLLTIGSTLYCEQKVRNMIKETVNLGIGCMQLCSSTSNHLIQKYHSAFTIREILLPSESEI